MKLECYFLDKDFLSKLSSEAVLVFMVLRSDCTLSHTSTAKFMKNKGILASGFSVQLIARMTGIPDLTVKRCIYDLSQLGYVKKLEQGKDDFVYQLGTVEDYSCKWFAELEVPKRKRGKIITADIRKALAEAKERRRQKAKERVRLSHEQKREMSNKILGEMVKTPKMNHQLMVHFKNLHLKHFRKRYVFEVGAGDTESQRREFSKLYSYLDRYLKYCGDDLEAAKNRMVFVFENWEKVKSELSWEGAMTLNFFGTVSLVKVVRMWQENGFKHRPKSENKIANRYHETEEDPDSGF